MRGCQETVLEEGTRLTAIKVPVTLLTNLGTSVRLHKSVHDAVPQKTHEVLFHRNTVEIQ